ncbi:intraflagellar transport 57 homolog (Chlamydomonas), isoform CRA_c, partial [Mus musculus]
PSFVGSIMMSSVLMIEIFLLDFFTYYVTTMALFCMLTDAPAYFLCIEQIESQRVTSYPHPTTSCTQEEETDNEENFIDLNVLKAQTYRLDTNESAKQEDILESTTDAAEWSLEVERVLPQLKVTIRTDNKDWRIHVDQMHQHKSGIESALKETKGFLDKLHNEISRTLEKIGSREKYINNQLEHLVQEYRGAQAQLSEARERYQQGNGGVTERTRLLSEVTEELEKVKQEMEEKGSSMTDGTPLVKIKQSLTKLKQETVQMDIRIGVVEHTLLQSKLKEKCNMTRDMHAAVTPESAIGFY